MYQTPRNLEGNKYLCKDEIESQYWYTEESRNLVNNKNRNTERLISRVKTGKLILRNCLKLQDGIEMKDDLEEEKTFLSLQPEEDRISLSMDDTDQVYTENEE